VQPTGAAQRYWPQGLRGYFIEIWTDAEQFAPSSTGGSNPRLLAARYTCVDPVRHFSSFIWLRNFRRWSITLALTPPPQCVV
jgi:hypothetical protein